MLGQQSLHEEQVRPFDEQYPLHLVNKTTYNKGKKQIDMMLDLQSSQLERYAVRYNIRSQ